MKLRLGFKIIIAAACGFAFSAIAANAQLMVNVSSQATWGPFVGGVNHNVTNNGMLNASQVVTTGLPMATPFTINYNPILGPSVVALGTGTLDVATFMFHSPVGPTQTFTTAAFKLELDFDSDGTFDATQNYVFSLTPFVSGNGLTGLSYSIVPVNFFGSATINGDHYAYASAVANATGVLFDGSNTTSLVQFQFLLTPVPEPSTYAAFGVLALGAMTYVRRRFRGASAGATLA